MTATRPPAVARLPAARAAVTVMFFVNGAVFGSWVSRIPDVSARVGAGEAQLGLALLAIAAGAIPAMALASPSVRRWGSRRVTVVAAASFCASVPLLGVVGSVPALVGALFLFGVANGALDVSMNDNGSRVERALARPVMGTLHAGFSTGGAAGALFGGLAAGAGISPALHFTLAAAILAALVVLAGRRVLDLPDPVAAAGPTGTRCQRWRVPAGALSGSLLLLLAVGVCAAFAEGAIADWSALYLVQTLASSTAFAAGGFVAFSALMVIGRLVQDRVVACVGDTAVRRWGSAIATAGMTTALLATNPVIAVVGFAAVGIGLAAIFPLTISAAARLPGLTSTAAIAAVSAAAYGSLLAGPPLIGLLAHAIGLDAALWSVTGALALITALPSSTRQPRSPTSTVPRTTADAGARRRTAAPR